jgi:hypothetical protein
MDGGRPHTPKGVQIQQLIFTPLVRGRIPSPDIFRIANLSENQVLDDMFTALPHIRTPFAP